MRLLCSYSTPGEAQSVVVRLQSAGIGAVLRDQHTVEFNWLISNAIGGVKVEVPDEEYEDALLLLGEPLLDPGLVVCPACGSGDVFIRPLSAFSAVCVFLKIPIPERVHTVDCRACKKTFSVGGKDVSA